MAKYQQKRNITNVGIEEPKPSGFKVRESYAKDILHNETVFPKPLEYEDIDREMFKFVDENFVMVNDLDGKKIPTFAIYSGQRFSEYSQTWKYTDDENNLLMNFKTINRDNNPKSGSNQGNYWNIPGERRYTLLMREVLEENGTECYEIYSMKQPMSIDLMYKVIFVTTKYEKLNEFNTMINDFFKSRQCYIRPNGHYIPMILDDITDETNYSIDGQKCFLQGYIIKAMAYIIQEKDFKVDKMPKRMRISTEGDRFKRKPEVSIEEYETPLAYKPLEISVDFKEFNDKVEFEIDTDVQINETFIDNIRNVRVFVNDEPIYHENGFNLLDGDNVKVKIKQIDVSKPSKITFVGTNQKIDFIEGEISEDASDDRQMLEEIVIE